MAQKLEEQELYTIAEAATAVRVSVSTVWRWIDAGKLAACRVGERRIRIRRADLETMVRPFQVGKETRMAKSEAQPEVFKMSALEAKDQMAVIQKARALRQQILERRGGEPLPPAWQDINESREERSAGL